MNQWRLKLDNSLPGDLRQIAEWIRRAEELLARGIPFDPAQNSADENFRLFKQLAEEHAVRPEENDESNEPFLFSAAFFRRSSPTKK